MKSFLVLAIGLMLGTSALAYKDGTYSCKNDDGLPDNVYKISSQSVGGSATLPYVEIHRFYKNENKVVESVIRGVATVAHTSQERSETLMVGYIRIEFDGDDLYGCRQ